jgi:hypothetical protein
MTMSKSNDISNIATLEDHHTLADSELDTVAGGWLPTGIPGAQMYMPVDPAAEAAVNVIVNALGR